MVSYSHNHSRIIIRSKHDSNQFSELEFLFQPIFNSVSKKLIAYEVLSKVRSPSGDILENEVFFNTIGDDVIKEIVLSQIHCINHLGNIRDIIISINITLTSLIDTDFVLAITSLSSTKLAFEIDDTSYIKYPDKIQANIDILRNAGHELWLDDYYGQLSSSEKMLTLIDWDIVKIDKSYLYKNKSILYNPESLMLKIAPHTKRGVIFEGIETESQSQQLAFVDAHLQGYLLSYPINWHSLQAQTFP